MNLTQKYTTNLQHLRTCVVNVRFIAPVLFIEHLSTVFILPSAAADEEENQESFHLPLLLVEDTHLDACNLNS